MGTARLSFRVFVACATIGVAPGLVFADQHWAFVPPRRPTVPTPQTSWARNEIDRFIAARLAAVDLRPSPTADRVTLARRVSFDLRGLPPSVEEVDAFAADRRAGAYERYVDRVLADPACGEKLARSWLDLARFGDTNGYQDDGVRTMWPYRDYVINAFNRNLTFDQFTIENIAGDLLPNATVTQRVASGFNRNHRFNEEGGSDPEEFLVVYAVDRTNATATTWLGLTFECAQCHDHKYDPISQRDYYQLYAFFNSLEGELGVSKRRRQPPFLELPTPAQLEAKTRIETEIVAAEAKIRARETATADAFADWQIEVASGNVPFAADLDGAEVQEIRALASTPRQERSEEDSKRLHAFFLRHFDAAHQKLSEGLKKLQDQRRTLDKEVPTTLVMQEASTRRAAFVLERGDFRRRGEEVTPAAPSALPRLTRDADGVPDRLDLAKWLIDPQHPLVARVTANRLWAEIFGVGLVKTLNDFGTRGEAPSHPELLDWLATEFVRLGWDIKALQRSILLSATYRQSYALDARAEEIDPENRLYWRSSRYRLAAEEIRDNALHVAGLLSRRIGGPSVMPPQPAGYFDDKSRDWKWRQSEGEDRLRRGLYTFWRRTTPYPSLMIFDAPSRETCVSERPRTNTPLQALVTLNDPVFFEAATAVAGRILKHSQPTVRSRVDYAFRLVLTHKPSSREIDVLIRLYETQLSRYRADQSAAQAVARGSESVAVNRGEDAAALAELAAWTTVANALLNLDAAVTRE